MIVRSISFKHLLGQSRQSEDRQEESRSQHDNERNSESESRDHSQEIQVIKDTSSPNDPKTSLKEPLSSADSPATHPEIHDTRRKSSFSGKYISALRLALLS